MLADKRQTMFQSSATRSIFGVCDPWCCDGEVLLREGEGEGEGEPRYVLCDQRAFREPRQVLCMRWIQTLHHLHRNQNKHWLSSCNTTPFCWSVPVKSSQSLVDHQPFNRGHSNATSTSGTTVPVKGTLKVRAITIIDAQISLAIKSHGEPPL